MPGRKFVSGEEYRFGFNGVEQEDEVAEGVNVTPYRMYNSQTGRWYSVEPRASELPFESTYSFSFNTPIFGSDPEGDVCVPCITAGIGAGVGTLVGVGMAIYDGKDFEGIVQDGAKGFVAGGIGGLTMGYGAGLVASGTAVIPTMALSGFAGSAGGSVATQQMDIWWGNQSEINVMEAFSDGAIGMAAGPLSYGAGEGLTVAIKIQTKKKIIDMTKRKVVKKVTRQAKRQWKRQIPKATRRKMTRRQRKDAKNLYVEMTKEAIRQSNGKALTWEGQMTLTTATGLEAGTQVVVGKVDNSVEPGKHNTIHGDSQRTGRGRKSVSRKTDATSIDLSGEVSYEYSKK